MKHLTQKEQQHAEQLIAWGVHHRVAIRYAVTGVEGHSMFRKDITRKLANACKEYERIHSIDDGDSLSYGRTYI